MIEGLILTKLKTFPSEKGSVYQSLSVNDEGYVGFGESYFSFIEYKAIKAWKFHKNMTLNLTVPIGAIRFNFIDLREGSATYKDRFEITLSKENYQRITVPPMILFGFKGLEKGSNIISNIADIIHDDEECMNIDIDKYEFK